jgi:hypothetical protein
LIHVPGDKNQSNNSVIDTVYISYPEKSLLINEIMYDPLSGEPEWIELINNSNYEINLYGWCILDNIDDETSGISEFITLLNNELIVIAGDEIDGITFQDDFPSLNNSGDQLFLVDPAKHIIDNVNYQDDWGGSDGFSLERITLFMDSNDPLNWGGSVNSFGSTPAEINSLYVNEIMEEGNLDISPNPFSPDNDRHEDELIISYNIPYTYSKLYIDIYSINGILVKSLSKGVIVPSNGFITWNGYNDNGRKCKLGIYILKFEADDTHSNSIFKKIERIILAKKLN